MSMDGDPIIDGDSEQQKLWKLRQKIKDVEDEVKVINSSSNRVK